MNIAVPLPRKTFAGLALALALVTTPFGAVQAEDARLREVIYDPAQVVLIEGRAKIQATITFGEDETIENVAIGDSAAWQVTPNKRANLLFLKPLAPRAATNMTVITDRRTYFFDLVANPAARPLYVMRFVYPEDERRAAEEAQAQLAQQANDAEMMAARDPYAVVDPATLNFAWKTKGDRKLLPVQTYDDGDATFLAWPEGRDVPAILITDAEGIEGPVNYTVRGDTIVIDGVPATITLRSGKDSATLTHQGPIRQAPPAARQARNDAQPRIAAQPLEGL
ncbi:type VI secretion protein [Altererythrobacter aurantiacus]|uniref:Type VI secretion protein n=1 Tax=Parapontixanthobacter aurantiacus TaxID=1463599 RepID=A0A844ZF95_9SPHN|nr:TrbG/VirB9 family P-type conjugative transfer protein [Parapontixanthobacter aurantiacus]MXO85912.1 type VI secretion protein [Parapontixanthobacter aurantiacus]